MPVARLFGLRGKFGRFCRGYAVALARPSRCTGRPCQGRARGARRLLDGRLVDAACGSRAGRALRGNGRHRRRTRFHRLGLRRGPEESARKRHDDPEENDYGYPPTPTHPRFWDDGQVNWQLGDTIPLTCPAILLHGQRDTEVPWEISLDLADKLGSDDVQVLLVKNADHRMSRDEDVARLLHTIETLLDRL